MLDTGTAQKMQRCPLPNRPHETQAPELPGACADRISAEIFSGYANTADNSTHFRDSQAKSGWVGSVTACGGRAVIFPGFHCCCECAATNSGACTGRKSFSRRICWPVQSSTDQKSTRLNSSHLAISYVL